MSKSIHLCQGTADACRVHFRLTVIFRQTATSAAPLMTNTAMSLAAQKVTETFLVRSSWTIPQEFFIFWGFKIPLAVRFAFRSCVFHRKRWIKKVSGNLTKELDGAEGGGIDTVEVIFEPVEWHSAILKSGLSVPNPTPEHRLELIVSHVQPQISKGLCPPLFKDFVPVHQKCVSQRSTALRCKQTVLRWNCWAGLVNVLLPFRLIQNWAAF